MEEGHLTPAKPLRGRPHRLWHGQVDRELHDAEAVVGTTDIMSGGDDLRELQMPTCSARGAEAVPGRTPIAGYVPRIASRFEHGERLAEAVEQLRRLDRVELLLGVVDVIHVDRLHTHVLAAAPQLIGQETGCDAVRIADDILRRDDAIREVLTLEKRVILLPRRRSAGVERDVPTFGAQDDFLACDETGSDGGADGAADHTLRSLASIVDGAVEHVDPALDRRAGGRFVPTVVGVITLAEVGPESQGGDAKHAIEWTIKLLAPSLGESLGVAEGALRSRSTDEKRHGGGGSRRCLHLADATRRDTARKGTSDVTIDIEWSSLPLEVASGTMRA